MKHLLKVLMLMGAVGALTGCSDDNPWAGGVGQGGIRLNLATSTEVIDALPTRAGSETLEAPAVENFNVKLEKTDGSYSKVWNSLTAFGNESAFDTGSYLLTAYYGNPEEEGFDLPYFEGTTNLTVLEARETETSVTATLANCMVSVEYTNAFKSYFSDYATTVHSEGHSYVKIGKDETRAAFINPGEVDLSVEITRPNGQSATIQPASFAAEARHHYHVTFDVNSGQVGEAQLSIIFDDSLVQEDVNIDLTEELFSTPAPSILTDGFTNGQTIEMLSQTAAGNSMKFTVIARGQLSECNLTIASADWTPAFGKEINLIEATPAQQEQLAQTGIIAKGLYKNPDHMASVDITNLLSTLPAGEYEVSLQAKDKYTRVSEPISVKLTCVPLTLSVEPQIGIFGVPKAVMNISYNGNNPKEDISFKALDQYGAWKNCEIESVTLSTKSRSIESKTYVFTVALPDASRSKIPVKVYLKNEEKATIEINIEKPEYTLESDAYANKAVLRINAEDASQRATIVNALNIYIDDTIVPAANIGHNTESGYVFVKGLTPGKTYNLKASLTNLSDEDLKELTITTEAATDIRNGDFSGVNAGSIEFNDIRLGGMYHVGALNYSVFTSILRDEPTGDWANINSKTAYPDATTLNTWFTVPSTWVENGEAVVRSVGYNVNGTTPATSPGTSFNFSTTYYCTSVPTFDNDNKASGELFLGTYSYNGSENRVDGIAFTSRPSYVTFDYAYTPYDGEVGLATVEVLNASGARIASGTLDLTSKSNMTKATIPLTYSTFGSKAAKLRVAFRSTKGSTIGLNIPSGSALNEGTGIGSRESTIATNAYKTFASGSVLKIDNVKLNY